MANELYSLENGGPACGLVFQDRLVLAGGIPIPDLVLASRVGTSAELDSLPSWQNFAQTETVGDEEVATEASGFFFEQSTGRNNPFVAMLQQEGLFLFGTEGEANVPAGPFTRTQAQIRENSWYGVERGIQPLIASGLTCFIQDGGQDLRGFAWTEAQRKYDAASLREVAGNIFTVAVSMAVRESTDLTAPTVFVVDEGGGAAVMSLRQTPPQIAWTVWSTGGAYERDIPNDDLRRTEDPDKFLGVASQGSEVLFLVERGDEVFVERLGMRDEGADCLDAGGRPFWATIETVPLLKPSQSGTRLSVLKSRIFGVVCLWEGVVPDEVYIHLQEATGRRPRASESGQASAEAYGSLSGWRRRTTVRLDLRRQCRLAGMSFRASG